MSTPLAPCKRPTVEVVQMSLDGLGWSALCHVTGCDWAYRKAMKVDAQEQAKRHRAAHRDAVPATFNDVVDDRPVTRCACGWVTPVGFTTRNDRDRVTHTHLADAHGLVIA